jgi:hypothetical protein
VNAALMLAAGLLAAWAALSAGEGQTDVVAAKDRDVVTITGCVHGSRLKLSRNTTPDTVTSVVHASEYVLGGQKEILTRLKKDHDSHLEEITGTLKIPPTLEQPDVHVRTTNVGEKTRVTMGTRQSTGSDPTAPLPVLPTLLVESSRHISDKCAAK